MIDIEINVNIYLIFKWVIRIYYRKEMVFINEKTSFKNTYRMIEYLLLIKEFFCDIAKRNISLWFPKPMFHILEYKVFQNMEYFGIWNILKYWIFLKMEYFWYGIFGKWQGKTKHFVISHKPYVPYFGI